MAQRALNSEMREKTSSMRILRCLGEEFKQIRLRNGRQMMTEFEAH